MKLNIHTVSGTLISLLSALSGCTANTVNEPSQTYDPNAGYRLANLDPGPHNTDSTFVVLTFSGGGTRAAALAYGVLLGLREIELPADPGQPPRTLLDEVDVISSVSGGSFTALAYGLWGEETFNGHFEKSFLHHNVERDLVLMDLNPLNCFANKSVLAARYYDRQIFKHATYQDLLNRECRPFINVNAADMARKEQFSFTQQDFDLLGSDLSKLPVAWAAASSSTFPILLDPVPFKYYHGEPLVDAVRYELTSTRDRFHPRDRMWARSLTDMDVFEQSGEIQLMDEEHKYYYVIDGGVVDNLGVTAFFKHLRDGGIQRLLKSGKIDRMLVVVVDAGTAPPTHIERSGQTPGSLATGVTTATSGIHTDTWILKTFLKLLLLEAYPETRKAFEMCASGEPANIPEIYTIGLYAADIHFSSVRDDRERHRLLTMPTSFVLSRRDVNTLIDAGKRLVMENSEIQRLCQDLRGG